MKKEDFISWASVNNWIPLIAMAISLALTFGATITRIALLEQKLDALQDSNNKIIATLETYMEKSQEDRKSLSLRLNTLETLQGIK